MEEKTFKLNVYDNNVINNLYNCQENEKYCKSMISKLVFYDRNTLEDLHVASFSKDNGPYDISLLEPVPFLNSNEKVDRIIPLEGHWIAVFLSDKKTKKLISDKLMYVSSMGDGYFSDDMETALKGKVPEDIYCRFIREYPNEILFLDRIFDKNDYSEIRKKLYDTARESLTEMFSELLQNPDIKLEDIRPLIKEGFRRRNEDNEQFEKIKALDFFYHNSVSDHIIEFDKQYSKFHSGSQPGKTE